MSNECRADWLMSHRSDFQRHHDLSNTKTRLSKIIAIASGKGGVGKTTTSLALAKELSQRSYKVLLVDCDYNLSNTAVNINPAVRMMKSNAK